jgi:ElaB/YqjD/DUF883 family membrane-anchored ribosome-binding protein
LPRKRTGRRLRVVHQNVKGLRKSVDKRLSKLGVNLDDIQNTAAKTMSEQPLLTLGIAFVVGMALGIALAKSGD